LWRCATRTERSASTLRSRSAFSRTHKQVNRGCQESRLLRIGLCLLIRTVGILPAATSSKGVLCLRIGILCVKCLLRCASRLLGHVASCKLHFFGNLGHFGGDFLS